MADGDLVVPVKIESTAKGGSTDDGFYTPLDTNEDFQSARGHYFQKNTGSDKKVYVARGAADDHLLFMDGYTPSRKLVDWLLESDPDALAITYTPTYDSLTGRVTNEQWDLGGVKLKTVDYTYTLTLVTSVVTKVWTGGTGIVGQTTKTISYSAGKITGETVVRDV